MGYYKTLMSRNNGAIPCHQDLCEFYAQPFQPDMIIDLFANTERASGIYLIGEGDWVDVYPVKKKYSPLSKINIPFGTLDQFIGDCQRFGLELVWKEEVIDKYLS